MVYCTKCGTLNPDDAVVCIKCAAPLQHTAVVQEEWGANWHRKYYDHEHYVKRSGLGTIFAGILIVIVGLTLFFSIYYEAAVNWGALWAGIIMLLGLWLIIVAFRIRRRHQRL
ncbi:MAG: zinc-ribbon domain-containing protein [Candidatus Bathyarchaeia archaeon]|jgi:uncharacterized membrane protein YvbJ